MTDKRSTLGDLAMDRLKLSGLSKYDAKKLNLVSLSAKQLQQLHPGYRALPALKIPYFSPTDPTKPLSSRPRWPAFYRIRYLEEPNDFSQVTEERVQRYAQEPGSGVCAYFPRSHPWPTTIKDPTIPLIITEGELKAAKACKEGLPTIGLGGVYNFRSARAGVQFLPELEAVSWVKREVYICYDSDVRTNPQVCAALNALAKSLEQRGAVPFLTCLPDVIEDGKTGLDDFLVVHTSQELVELLRASPPLTLARQLLKLNEQVIYVRNPGLVLDLGTDQRLSPASFKDHQYSHLGHAEQVLKPDGSISMKPTSGAAAWLRWPLRHEASRLTYEPGQDKLWQGQYNIWPGWGIEPKRGDHKPFLALLDHLFSGAEPAAMRWFLSWCAYPLQHPGTKLFTAAVLHGTRHGTGKSLIGYTLGKIYGSNFTEINQADLHGGFNEWAEAKQFVMGDDVTGSNKRQDADTLKKLITQKELRVNVKYVPTYVVPDYINYLFTSNHPDAFFLEDDDRRYFVHEVTMGPLGEEFYRRYDAWLHGGTDGIAAVFRYLLSYDTKGFNPAASALKTMAKERMILDVKSDLGGWVARLLLDPDAVLRLGELELRADLYTNRQLLGLYDPTQHTGTTANGLGRELRRAGIPQVCQGQPVQTPWGQDRLYVVRNRKRWLKATQQQVKRYLAEQEDHTKSRAPKY